MTKKKHEIKVTNLDHQHSIYGDGSPETELNETSGTASPDSANGKGKLDQATVSESVEEIGAVNETETGEMESDTLEVEEIESRLAEMTANWQRERAAFLNYKHRIEQERAEVRKYAVFDLALDLLRVLDYFESSVSYAQNLPQDAENVIIGVKYTIDELTRVLGSHGITQISVNPGDKFDPAMMEAADSRVKEDMAPGTVIAVQRSGWTLHDRILRPARVEVTAASGPEKTDEGGDDDG